jgi:hypothetical protein
MKPRKPNRRVSRECEQCGTVFAALEYLTRIGKGRYCSLSCATKHMRTSDPLPRFEAQHVKADSGCWIWTGAKDLDGYGFISVAGKQTRAHRYAYSQFVGPIPEDNVVCHHCDTPSCVNPRHLFVGLHIDNVRDMDLKHRRGKSIFQRIDESTARQIKAMAVAGTKKQYEIAAIFNVSHQLVSAIKRGESWANI